VRLKTDAVVVENGVELECVKGIGFPPWLSSTIQIKNKLVHSRQLIQLKRQILNSPNSPVSFARLFNDREE
jgi:hypothetical protein